MAHSKMPTSPQRYQARSRTPMIVQRGQLINAGRWFPAKHLVSFARADKCFVGKPVKFSHAALGFGPKRNSRRACRCLGERHLIGRQSDLGRVAAACEEVAPDR